MCDVTRYMQIQIQADTSPVNLEIRFSSTLSTLCMIFRTWPTDPCSDAENWCKSCNLKFHNPTNFNIRLIDLLL